MFRRALYRLVQASVPQQRHRPILRSTLLLSSGGLLGWLNIDKNQTVQDTKSTITKIDPDSQLVETIQLAAKAINVREQDFETLWTH